MTSSANSGCPGYVEHPVQFRAGSAVELLECRNVTIGDSREQYDQLRLRQHPCSRP